MELRVKALAVKALVGKVKASVGLAWLSHFKAAKVNKGSLSKASVGKHLVKVSVRASVKVLAQALVRALVKVSEDRGCSDSSNRLPIQCNNLNRSAVNRCINLSERSQ
jgi:hypothetical protein